jgi:hypothetical protein
MKSYDFLNEGIVEDTHEMHQDHEVQMARKDCYQAAEHAIALHKLLQHVSENQGIEGWVAAKITLAADYLNTVREYLEYELMNQHSEPMGMASAPVSVEFPIAESRQIDEGKMKDLDLDLKKPPVGMTDQAFKKKYNMTKAEANSKFSAKKEVAEVAPPGAKAERMVKHIKKGYARDGKLTPKEKSIAYATAWKAHNKGKVEEQNVAEGLSEMDKSQTPPGRDGSNDSDAGKKEYTAKTTTPEKVAKHGEKILNKIFNKKKGVAEGHADQQRRIFKKNGKPVGEVGIDRESSPGNGPWYVKHYASGYDVVGFDSYEEAVAELKHCLKQGVAEATGDEKFDTMMGQMQREPIIPDPQMPPTDVKDLYQWAVKNNKPYHKIFAEWAMREGYKSVAPALQKAGNLDSDALDYWTPRVWKIYWGEVRGIDSEMPPEWAKKRIPAELRYYLDDVFDAYDRIVFDWPTEYRQIGQKGMAEGLDGNWYVMALKRYPQLKRVNRQKVIDALNNAYEDYLMHYGYEGIGPDEESSMIDRAVKGLKQGVIEMSAGSVATVVNPTPKNRAKVGTLFGGTYQREEADTPSKKRMFNKKA